MHVIDRVIVSIIYYNACIRDTLEYCLEKDSYDVKVFEHKKNVISNELKADTPLKVFLDKQGENGEKTKKIIADFINDFYSDDSTVIKLANDGLRVDHAQNIKILEAVLPLHENLNSIVRIHADFTKQNNIKHDVVDKLLIEDERFYRAVALLALSNELFKQFEEYNKARREAKGERTPQSNFIEQDLNKLVQLTMLVKQNATCIDTLYTNACDSLIFAIEMMNGRRAIPEGSDFGKVFADCSQKIADFVADSEAKWRESYAPAVNELVADAQAEQAQAQQAAETAKEEAPVEEAKPEETPAEEAPVEETKAEESAKETPVEGKPGKKASWFKRKK